MHAVVGNVEILVHAALDHSTDDEAKRTGRDDAVDGLNAAIGEIDARRKVGDGPPVQESPRLTVGKHGPTADEPRVIEIQAPFARPINLTVGLADQDCLTVMDRDLVRTDLNPKWHQWLRSCRRGAGRGNRTAPHRATTIAIQNRIQLRRNQSFCAGAPVCSLVLVSEHCASVGPLLMLRPVPSTIAMIRALSPGRHYRPC